MDLTLKFIGCRKVVGSFLPKVVFFSSPPAREEERMCVFFKRLLGLSFISPPYRKLFSPSLTTKDIGLLIRCISLFELHRGLRDILPCDFTRNKRFRAWVSTKREEKKKRDLGPVRSLSSNNNFHILNNITNFFTHFFIQMYFEKFQITILKLLYQIPP